jgi:oxygen-independent coproporphyrinogen-3 oxidase
VHIYVHVPFCARRCSYCDFAIAVRRTTPDQQYIAAISQEWRHWAALRGDDGAAPVTTLYFGGGTPSRLEPASIAQLIDTIAAERRMAPDAEVTLETNPDDVTEARAHAWSASGVNRVSLGVQSHDPAVLEWMHRTHRAEQVPGAVAALRGAGIHNISIDMIFALPTALGRDWRQDLQRTIGLEPAHVSLYGLTVEPHTLLFRWTQQGGTVAPTDDRYAEEYLEAHESLTAAGYEHYEVSNAGRPGFRARHNFAYWTGVDYVGLGPSAHSLDRDVRRWNVREWAAYQTRLARGESVTAGSESLDAATRALERRYLRLRTSDGLRAAELPVGTAECWHQQGWATLHDGLVCLTAEGWLRLDALVGAARRS